MEGFIRLEKKYGIKVVEDELFNPLTGRISKGFKIYTADGCPWENGLTRDGVKRECEEFGKAFLKIKNRVSARED